MKKRGQAGIEYMIVIGFVTMIIISILGLSLFYSNQIKEQLRLNQVESFSVQFINFAESVFFAGEPSKTTVELYLPEYVTEVIIDSNYLIISTQIGSGINKRIYESKVPMNGTVSSGAGIKRLTIEATNDFVSITEN